jgi:hypothetical protein
MAQTSLTWDMLPWETCEGCGEFHTFWFEESRYPEMPYQFLQWIKFCDREGDKVGYTQEWTRRHLRVAHPELYTMFLLMNEED